MLLSYNSVSLYYRLGLYTKQDIKDMVTVEFFAQADYDKLFPEG